MNKSQRKLLKNLAKDIDDIFIKEIGSKKQYHSLVNSEVSGEDAILAGNKDADPEETYMVKMPMIHEVNHFRRLKRSLVKEGPKGVVNYLKSCGFKLDESIIHERLAV